MGAAISGSRSITSYMWYCGHPSFGSLWMHTGGLFLSNRTVNASCYKQSSQTMDFRIASIICLFGVPVIPLITSQVWPQFRFAYRVLRVNLTNGHSGNSLLGKKSSNIRVKCQLVHSLQINTNYQDQRYRGCTGQLYRSLRYRALTLLALVYIKYEDIHQ